MCDTVFMSLLLFIKQLKLIKVKMLTLFVICYVNYFHVLLFSQCVPVVGQ
jgi:hypothetical protein